MTNATALWSNRRTFFLAANTGFVTNGRPDNRYLEFYRTRSSPKLGCAIVGNVVIPGGHGTNGVTPTLTDDAIWSDLAHGIRSRGSLPGIQLATTWEGYQGQRKFVSAGVSRAIQEARELASTYGTARVTILLDQFYAAALMAARHGFGHIQIHAAHGYLLSLLIDERFHVEAFHVRQGLSKLSEQLQALGLETSIRVSLRTGEAGIDGADGPQLQDAISELSFDYVDLSSGFYNIDKRLIYPSRPDVLKTRLEDSLAISTQHANRAFILSGYALRQNWASLPSNLHLGLCRDLIANPHVLDNPGDGCMNLNKCHYFSRGKLNLSCGRWDER